MKRRLILLALVVLSLGLVQSGAFASSGEENAAAQLLANYERIDGLPSSVPAEEVLQGTIGLLGTVPLPIPQPVDAIEAALDRLAIHPIPPPSPPEVLLAVAERLDPGGCC